MALDLFWKRCGDDRHYCDLLTLKLENISDAGVYVIWHEGNPSRVVRVGQGDVAARLATHRRDTEIVNYGKLRVTWAVVPASHRDGVERYLADTWHPLVGDAFPVATPIAVNSPFGS